MIFSDLSPLPARIAAKIRVAETGCWVWTGYVKKSGYGMASWPKPEGGHEATGVHRIVWTVLVGRIPPGMTLDHLCHTRDETCEAANDCLHRRCVNPGHLEVVTGRENLIRGRSLAYFNRLKTHCPKGHELSGDNLASVSNGTDRVCKTCVYARRRISARAKRERELAMTDEQRMAAWRESQNRKRAG